MYVLHNIQCVSAKCFMIYCNTKIKIIIFIDTDV